MHPSTTSDDIGSPVSAIVMPRTINQEQCPGPRAMGREVIWIGCPGNPAHPFQHSQEAVPDIGSIGAPFRNHA